MDGRAVSLGLWVAKHAGQVHRATTLCGQEVAVKVQFPGVSRSIDSDLGNLERLLKVADVVPAGLFVEKIIAFAKQELKAECDYEAEARNQTRFRQQVRSAYRIGVARIHLFERARVRE